MHIKEIPIQTISELQKYPLIDMGTIISISLSIIFPNDVLDFHGIISYMIKVGHTRLFKSVCKVGQCYKMNSNMFEITGCIYVAPEVVS